MKKAFLKKETEKKEKKANSKSKVKNKSIQKEKKTDSKKDKKEYEDKEYENLLSFQRNLNIDKELFVSEIKGRKDIKQLEHYLHFIMIRLNNIKELNDIYNFNILFEYHKLKTINEKDQGFLAAQGKKEDIEKHFPYVREFYDICLEFLLFLTDLAFEYNILENNSFSYKKNKVETNELTSELSENNFHFQTFFFISKYYDNPVFQATDGLHEKNLILQYKFLVILNKFFEVYPLPKDPIELEVFFTNLIKKSKEQGKKKNRKTKEEEKKIDKSHRSEEINLSKSNQNLSEREKKEDEFEEKKKEEEIKESEKGEENVVPVQSQSIYSRIFCCCCKPKKDNVDANKIDIVKLFTPLMTLSLSQNPNINLQVLRRMLHDFTKAYLKVEELLFKEMSKMSSKETRDTDNLGGPDSENKTSKKETENNDN